MRATTYRNKKGKVVFLFVRHFGRCTKILRLSEGDEIEISLVPLTEASVSTPLDGGNVPIPAKQTTKTTQSL